MSGWCHDTDESEEKTSLDPQPQLKAHSPVTGRHHGNEQLDQRQQIEVFSVRIRHFRGQRLDFLVNSSFQGQVESIRFQSARKNCAECPSFWRNIWLKSCQHLNSGGNIQTGQWCPSPGPLPAIGIRPEVSHVVSPCAPSSGQHCNCFLRTSVKNRELGLQNTSHRFLHNKLTEFIRIAEGCPWNGQGEFGDQSSVGSVESMSAPFKVLRDFQDFQDFQHEKTESKSKRGGVGLGQQVPYRQLKLSWISWLISKTLQPRSSWSPVRSLDIDSSLKYSKVPFLPAPTYHVIGSPNSWTNRRLVANNL